MADQSLADVDSFGLCVSELEKTVSFKLPVYPESCARTSSGAGCSSFAERVAEEADFRAEFLFGHELSCRKMFAYPYVLASGRIYVAKAYDDAYNHSLYACFYIFCLNDHRN